VQCLCFSGLFPVECFDCMEMENGFSSPPYIVNISNNEITVIEFTSFSYVLYYDAAVEESN